MFNEGIIVEIYKKILQDKDTSPEYNRLRRKCIEQRDEFENDLNPEQKEMLNTLIEQRTIMEEVECKELFVEGFKMGAKITSEVCCNKM